MLLGLQTGIGPGGVDKGKYRAAELLRLLHEPQSLAVALRPRHPEVAPEVFLQRFAFPGADNGDGPPVEQGDAA